MATIAQIIHLSSRYLVRSLNWTTPIFFSRTRCWLSLGFPETQGQLSIYFIKPQKVNLLELGLKG